MCKWSGRVEFEFKKIKNLELFKNKYINYGLKLQNFRYNINLEFINLKETSNIYK